MFVAYLLYIWMLYSRFNSSKKPHVIFDAGNDKVSLISASNYIMQSHCVWLRLKPDKGLATIHCIIACHDTSPTHSRCLGSIRSTIYERKKQNLIKRNILRIQKHNHQFRWHINVRVISSHSICQVLLKYSGVRSQSVKNIDCGYMSPPDTCIIHAYHEVTYTFPQDNHTNRSGYIKYSGTKETTLKALFMGPTWGLSGADRTQVGPMLAPWTLLSGYCQQSLGVCSDNAVSQVRIFILYFTLNVSAVRYWNYTCVLPVTKTVKAYNGMHFCLLILLIHWPLCDLNEMVVIFKMIVIINEWSIFCKIAHRKMSRSLTGNKSTVDQLTVVAR